MTSGARADLTAKGIPADALASIESVEIRVAGKRVEMQPVGQQSAELTPTGRGTFAVPELDVTVTFELDPAGGPAARMRLVQSGLTVDYERN